MLLMESNLTNFFSDEGFIILNHLKKKYEDELAEIRSELDAYKSYNEYCSFENDEYIHLTKNCVSCNAKTYIIRLYEQNLYQAFRKCHLCKSHICLDCSEKNNKLKKIEDIIYCYNCL